MERMFMLIMSAKPATASAASESGSDFDSPKTIIIAPNVATTTSSVGPARWRRGRRARTMPARSAPAAGAARSRPTPMGPTWRIVSAKTGASAIESPNSTATRSSEIAPRSMRVWTMNPIPAERFFHVSSMAGAVARTDSTPRMATRASTNSAPAVR